MNVTFDDVTCIPQGQVDQVHLPDSLSLFVLKRLAHETNGLEGRHYKNYMPYHVHLIHHLYTIISLVKEKKELGPLIIGTLYQSIYSNFW